MNYLEAKSVLLKDKAPQISLKYMAIEVATMVGLAGIMVLLFA